MFKEYYLLSPGHKMTGQGFDMKELVPVSHSRL